MKEEPEQVYIKSYLTNWWFFIVTRWVIVYIYFVKEENSLNLSNYKLLGENKEIKLDFETRSSPRQEKKIVLSCVFANLTDKLIKKIEFNVLDTLNTRLVIYYKVCLIFSKLIYKLRVFIDWFVLMETTPMMPSLSPSLCPPILATSVNWASLLPASSCPSVCVAQWRIWSVMQNTRSRRSLILSSTFHVHLTWWQHLTLGSC